MMDAYTQWYQSQHFGVDFKKCPECGSPAILFGEYGGKHRIYQYCKWERKRILWRNVNLPIFSRKMEANVKKFLRSTKLVSVPELAKILGCSEVSVRMLSYLRKVPFVRIGSRIMFFSKDIDWIKTYYSINGPQSRRRKNEKKREKSFTCNN